MSESNWIDHRMVLKALLAVGLQFLSVGGCLAASKSSEFYGTWLPKNEFVSKCKDVQGEGSYFTIGKNYYEPGFGGRCDAKMWMRNGKLNLRASCISAEEDGLIEINRTFELLSKNRLLVKGKIYRRCSGKL